MKIKEGVSSRLLIVMGIILYVTALPYTLGKLFKPEAPEFFMYGLLASLILTMAACVIIIIILALYYYIVHGDIFYGDDYF